MKRSPPYKALDDNADAEMRALYGTGEYTVKALAALYEVSPATVSRTIRRGRSDNRKSVPTYKPIEPRFTKEQMRWIKQAFFSGRSFEWIAREIKSPHTTIRAALLAEGVSTDRSAAYVEAGYRRALKDVVEFASEIGDESLKKHVVSLVRLLQQERKASREAHP